MTMKLEQAIAAMREGKKVRITDWGSDAYMEISDVVGVIVFHRECYINSDINYFLNNDYELYEEEEKPKCPLCNGIGFLSCMDNNRGTLHKYPCPHCIRLFAGTMQNEIDPSCTVKSDSSDVQEKFYTPVNYNSPDTGKFIKTVVEEIIPKLDNLKCQECGTKIDWETIDGK